MLLDQSTKVLHSPMNEVVLRLERLVEVFEDQLNLSSLFLPLVCHVARVELSKHVIFALHLAHFGLLSSDLCFCFT